MPIQSVLKTITKNYNQVWRHKKGPVVPNTSPAADVSKDEILNQIALEVPHDQSKSQKEHPAQVTIVSHLADRDRPSKLNPITGHKEDHAACPLVWVSLRFSPTNQKLYYDSQDPDRDESECNELIGWNLPVNSIHYELFWHASQSVENQVPRQASFNIREVEVIHEYFHDMVDKVPLFGAVNETHELLVGAADPHDTNCEQKKQHVVQAHNWVLLPTFSNELRLLFVRLVGLGC